ncbi:MULTISPECIES: Rieske 2Fe-2S domain-containing protein [unclassified Pseudomonas]|uniref:Rieske 2Fe-2S domain-containing protein n=1 Tax=unclassified Pseudomonas TaxID=196821 RepID=UPI003FA6A1B8
MYVKNARYVAAWPSELLHSLRDLTIMDQPVLQYRTQAGEAVAIENRCYHCRVPPAFEHAGGRQRQFGYHRFTVDCHGTCVSIRSEEQITP